MKAQTKVCPARVPDFGMAIDQFRVGKNRPEDMEEIAECFLKLRELVPSIPQNKKLTKVQLLQHVIDYIMDLELTLDCQPTIKAVAPLLLPPCSSATERRPLAESSQLNTSHLNQGQSPKDEEMDTESEFRPSFC